MFCGGTASQYEFRGHVQFANGFFRSGRLPVHGLRILVPMVESADGRSDTEDRTRLARCQSIIVGTCVFAIVGPVAPA